MIFEDATAIAAAVRAGEVSAVEVVAAHLEHIHRHNSDLGVLPVAREVRALMQDRVTALAAAGARMEGSAPDGVDMERVVAVWVALAEAERNGTMHPVETPLLSVACALFDVLGPTPRPVGF